MFRAWMVRQSLQCYSPNCTRAMTSRAYVPPLARVALSPHKAECNAPTHSQHKNCSLSFSATTRVPPRRSSVLKRSLLHVRTLPAYPILTHPIRRAPLSPRRLLRGPSASQCCAGPHCAPTPQRHACTHRHAPRRRDPGGEMRTRCRLELRAFRRRRRGHCPAHSP